MLNKCAIAKYTIRHSPSNACSSATYGDKGQGDECIYLGQGVFEYAGHERGWRVWWAWSIRKEGQSIRELCVSVQILERKAGSNWLTCSML